MRRHFLPKAERGKFLRSTNRKETNVYKDTTQALKDLNQARYHGYFTQVLDNEIDDVGVLLAKAAGF